MGLYRGVIEAIIREKSRKPFPDKAYTFGRQTVDATPEQVIAMFSALGVPSAVDDPSELDIDRTTLAVLQHPTARNVRDVDFFRTLGTTVYAIDVSDHEGAEIISDLNRPIPSPLEASCGLLVDGSTLDNIFDPSTGLKNAARLLQPGGRCFLVNMGNTRTDYGGIPYTMFNPFWFFDYFVWNDFDYCQVYLLIFDGMGPLPAVYAISYEHAAQHWGDGIIKPIVSEHIIALMVFAEKGTDSTWDKTPTQHAYRTKADWTRYNAIVEGYLAQKRPYLICGAVGAIPKGMPDGYMRVWPDGRHTYTGLPDRAD
jgi:hypothetical protein